MDRAKLMEFRAFEAVRCPCRGMSSEGEAALCLSQRLGANPDLALCAERCR